MSEAESILEEMKAGAKLCYTSRTGCYWLNGSRLISWACFVFLLETQKIEFDSITGINVQYRISK